MFLIFGVTPRERLLTSVGFVCEFCRVPARQDVVESASRFSAFFIPLITFARRYAVICSNCGGVTALSRDEAMHGAEWAIRNRQLA